MLSIKRIYEKKSPDDGIRIYVDRLWPRGLTKTQAAMDEWLKDISPSVDLRKWFGHQPEKFPEFKQRYMSEMLNPGFSEKLKYIADLAQKQKVTLLYSAKNEQYNNAVVVAGLINSIMKKTKTGKNKSEKIRDRFGSHKLSDKTIGQ